MDVRRSLAAGSQSDIHAGILSDAPQELARGQNRVGARTRIASVSKRSLAIPPAPKGPFIRTFSGLPLQDNLAQKVERLRSCGFLNAGKPTALRLALIFTDISSLTHNFAVT